MVEQLSSAFRLEDLPPQPPSVDEARTRAELDGDGSLVRFALSFDGYAHLGDRWPEILEARVEEWREERKLPRDLDTLRALLFLTFSQERLIVLDDTLMVRDDDGALLHAPDVEQITDARREHERFKHALLAKIRELVDPVAGAS